MIASLSSPSSVSSPSKLPSPSPSTPKLPSPSSLSAQLTSHLHKSSSFRAGSRFPERSPSTFASSRSLMSLQHFLNKRSLLSYSNDSPDAFSVSSDSTDASKNAPFSITHGVTLAHATSYYNRDKSIVYTEANPVDMMLSASINSSVCRLGSPALASVSSKTASLPAIPEMDETPSESIRNSTLPHSQMLQGSHAEGFTLLQAILFLIQNQVVFTRGEGLDFFQLLEQHHILQPRASSPSNSPLVRYERRFRTTVYHIVEQNRLNLYPFPEISLFDDFCFESRTNYCYLHYVFKQLLKSSHAQVLLKALVFLYENYDFFNGDHRLQVRPSSSAHA